MFTSSNFPAEVLENATWRQQQQQQHNNSNNSLLVSKREKREESAVFTWASKITWLFFGFKFLRHVIG